MKSMRPIAAVLPVVLLTALLAPAGAFAANKTPVAQKAGQVNQPLRRVPAFPPDVKARGESLLQASSPEVRAWLSQHAAAVAQGPGDAATMIASAIQSRWPHLRPAAVNALTFLLMYDAAKRLQDQIKQDLDSKSELGETESLRLQMAMDRVSKFMTALSNILKKLSDTSESIVHNLK